MNAPLYENEHTELIGDRLRLIVSPEHTFGTDALLLAAFAFPKQNERACDLGTGCGVIPFYWLARGKNEATAVELQEKAVDQLTRSAEQSGVAERLSVVRADIRSLKGVLPAGAFGCVSMNPPYYKAGHGRQSEAAADAISRHETAVTLPECCAAAAYLLKFGGRFCLCLPPTRLAEAVCAMHEAGLEPKRLRFVQKSAMSAPWLFLLEGKKGRAPGLEVEKPLCIYGENGAFSEELETINAPYRKD